MREKDEAYRSEIRIHYAAPNPLQAARDRVNSPTPGPGPGGEQRPGAVSNSNDTDLAGLRADVVLPVVTSLLTPQELDEVELAWGEMPHQQDMWVRVVARGEVFSYLLDSPEWEGGGQSDRPLLAQRLAEQLEDWVCETAFAWGERRQANYTLRLE